MNQFNIEINGEDTCGSVFTVFEKMAYHHILNLERHLPAQREDIAMKADATRIAGEITDTFYRAVNKAALEG